MKNSPPVSLLSTESELAAKLATPDSVGGPDIPAGEGLGSGLPGVGGLESFPPLYPFPAPFTCLEVL
jgi:hypothetical protein